VYLRLKSTGSQAVLPFAGIDLSDPRQAPYYLVDTAGRRYPARGSDWTRREAESAEAALTVRPGETREFQLDFEGIPAGVTGLTLVMERVPLEGGSEHTLRVPLPLPSAGATPALPSR
jgi:hypothetical protein